MRSLNQTELGPISSFSHRIYTGSGLSNDFRAKEGVSPVSQTEYAPY